MLVLEPIFEADFHPSSYGFRPNRRTMDAVAEIQMFASRSYEWVLEADIAACFDEIDHAALLGRVRRRIGDKRVLALVKAFLKAGILSEDQAIRENNSGTPQGGILSPLLANIALEVLDEHFARLWQTQSATRVDRSRRRRHGQPIYRLVRYADDFVVLVSGSREHAEAMHDQVAAVLAPIGLRLSPEKTAVVHIDEGFDFLGFRIQRHQKPGTNRRYVYTFPAKKSLAKVKRKVKAITTQGTNNPLSALLDQINPVLRGWTSYFRYAVANVDLPLSEPLHLVADRRMDTPQTPQNELEDPAAHATTRSTGGGRRTARVVLFEPGRVVTRRYRYRGDIPPPWPKLKATS